MNDKAGQIEGWLREGLFDKGGYAFFRLPETDTFTFLGQRDAPEAFPTVSEIGEREGFLIAPFAVGEETPLLYITPEMTVQAAVPVPKINATIALRDADGRKAYGESFRRLHGRLQAGGMRKVVLARRQSAVIEGEVLPTELFYRACVEYPRSYVALWWTEASGMWLVASPEILLERDERGFRTMALAGTMVRELAPKRAEEWSEKNKEEQALVTTFIEECLRPLATKMERGETYPIAAGNVVHLRTDFRFQSSAPTRRIVEALHPTPAICGTPREEAMTAISACEDLPRRYYAGYSGPLGREEAHLFVSLRCMELAGEKVTLYAGGGLLKDSVEEDEWQETSKKMETMRSLFRPQK